LCSDPAAAWSLGVPAGRLPEDRAATQGGGGDQRYAICACYSAGVLVVMNRRVALLANRVGFRLAHALAAHWQVVARTLPTRTPH